MKLELFHVDAFASEPFHGNPAAVVPLKEWLSEDAMQAIAVENNLSETAFFVAAKHGEYVIRWFTPSVEVDLCGHATLASAYVICRELEPGLERVRFSTREAGNLAVRREGERLALDFPARPPRAVADEALKEAVSAALRARVDELHAARDLLAILPDEEAVRNLRPDLGRIAALETFAVIASARGRDADFVSRFFAPRKGVPEDPVTGSAHCTLIPYWAEVLGKQTLYARQVSQRGGELWCRLEGQRVQIAGQCVLFMRGTMEV